MSTQFPIPAASPTRDQAREALRQYQVRTGLSLGEIATRLGYARPSLLQFVSKGQ